MTRSFLSFILVLATAMLILLGGGATPALAQQAASVTASAAPGSKRYPELQEALDLLLKKRDGVAAVKKLEEASRKYPELPSAHVLMYTIFAQVNQPTAARAELDEAIKTSPTDPEPYVILGNIALQERRVADAKRDFDKAKQLLAGYTNAERKGAVEQQTLSGLALVAESGSDWKAAEAYLRDLLKLVPRDLVAHQRLARSLFWQGKAADAYAVLKQAKQIDRENAWKYNTREVFLTPEAIMAMFYGQYEGPKSTTGNAEKWFRAALKNAPNDLPTCQCVAIWALEKGKLDFAKEQAEAALRIEAADVACPTEKRRYSGSNVGRMLRGLVALWEKDWPEADRYFEIVILDNPNDFIARNNLALALVEQNDPAKRRRALDYAEANVRDHQNNPDALSTLGWVHFGAASSMRPSRPSMRPQRRQRRPAEEQMTTRQPIWPIFFTTRARNGKPRRS